MNIGDFAPSSHHNSQPMILFVGDHACFSDIYLRLISEEFVHHEIRCERHIEQVADLLSANAVRVAFVVVCCKYGRTALALLRDVIAYQPDVQTVLAYGTISEVRDVLQTADEIEALNRLSFLPMRARIDSVISILHLLISGECHVSSDVLKLLLELKEKQASRHYAAAHPAIEPTLNPDINSLTARELEVLTLLSEGAPNKLIADQLTLSPSTVKLHIHHIIAKLGVRNRTEAAVAYLSAGLTRSENPVS